MFESLQKAPDDPILGLSEAFARDPNPEKINLTVGVYQDAAGATPILECVRRVRDRIIGEERSKAYLPIAGGPEFATLVEDLVFGQSDPAAAGRAATMQAPGGTSALRLAGDLVRRLAPDASVWVSEPTWPNHAAVLGAAGVPIETYPYLDASRNALRFDAMLAALREAPRGDVVVLHACCHNPTGVDPTSEQWREIASTLAGRGLLPLVDFAYQGFADGIDEDALAVRALCRESSEALVCTSFSKNFGLYNERVGALTLLASSSAALDAARSHAKRAARANYSNPPAHGGAIVTTILRDSSLRALWKQEVKSMRERINGMRGLLADTLAALGPGRDFSFIKAQRGMFSLLDLSKAQIDTLRDRHSIYIVDSGRINVAGVTEANVERLCRAISAVL